ncbi:Fe-S cluster assembly protein SufB [Candidatus Woesearchaeota archaeon CG10_big_fil_rev_8_21_14_0_10_37_12]|nr:MAG: Fe-S cluster assembly protein SufB [Candidatus Woesearchaeota archaeon CG10_big_fil_rev_8_21_14_0_10_37_12]
MSELTILNNNYEKKYGFRDPETFTFKTQKGLSEDIIKQISKVKNEPDWMLDLRLKAFRIFKEKPMPNWGADLSAIDFDKYTYFFNPTDKTATSWEDVPESIKKTFDRLGIPEAEQKFLGGVGAQYESQTVYHNLQESLRKQGVVFTDTDTAVREHPELVKKYFASVVPAGDNKFAALNTAVWSGGSFIYIPPGVKVKLPLQAYFRINAKNIGQFERTLIIVDNDAEVSYIEGCTAPVYSTDSLHAAVVEVIALEGSKVRYTTIQNWSSNVYNLVTKRAFAHKNATVEWIDGNLGSKITMKYPAVFLMGDGAKADILSVAYAGKDQQQDAGGKVVHLASNTTSRIVSKSISKDGGRSSYRGLLRIGKNAENCMSSVQCDALMLDSLSRSDTYPTMKIENKSATIAHEARVGKIGEEQLFYLMSRGLSEADALAFIVLGFISEFTKELPMEYSVELNKLIRLEMENSIG